MSDFTPPFNASLKTFKTQFGRDIFFVFSPGTGPTLVFLNGLDDSLEVWRKTVSQLKTSQPCLFVDLLGQGQSLFNEMSAQHVDENETESFDYHLSVDQQCTALQELLKSLSIVTVDLVGNSYGAGVALWFAGHSPSQVRKLVLLNPFILRLDLAFPLARLYAAQYEWLQALTPKAFQSPFRILENTYGRFIENYMDHRFRQRIPDRSLRRVKVELSKGMMGFNSFDVLRMLPDHSVFLLFSELDTLVPKSLYLEFWMRLSPQKKRNCFQLLGGDHLLLETGSDFVKQHLQMIFDADSAFGSGSDSKGGLAPSSKIVSCVNREKTSSSQEKANFKQTFGD